MSDTENIPRSAAAPFENYRRSLRRMKVEADEARKALEVLAKLRRTFPLWWQMFELKDREISYQSFQKWCEEASELLNSAQDDINSGKLRRLEKGYKNIKELYSNLDDVRRSMKDDIKQINENIKTKKKKISKIENKKENMIEKKHKEKQELVSRVNAQAGVAAVIGFLGGCSMGLVEGSAFVNGIMGLLAGGAIVWFVAFKLIVQKGIEPLENDITDIELEKSEKESEIKKLEKELNNLEKYHKKVLQVSNVDNNKKIQKAENIN